MPESSEDFVRLLVLGGVAMAILGGIAGELILAKGKRDRNVRNELLRKRRLF